MPIPLPILAELDGQIIIIIIAMVIGGIQWLVERIRKNAKRGDQADGAEFEDLYEDARQEILDRQAREYPTETELQERLAGTPPAPRPPAIPTVIPQPRTSQAPSWSPGPTPPPIPGMAATRTRTPARPTLSAAEKEALKRLQARQSKGPRRGSSRTSSQSRIRALLASPSSARDAIVLSEILGPPKGAV